MRAIGLITCAVLGLAPPALAYECSAEKYKADQLRASLWIGMNAVKPDKGGAGLALQVSEDFWGRMNLDARREFFDVMQCAVAGPGKGLASLRLVSMQTGVELATLKMGRVEFKK